MSKSEVIHTVPKMKFSIKDFFKKLRICSHLLKKSLMQTSFFVQCQVPVQKRFSCSIATDISIWDRESFEKKQSTERF